MNSFFPHHWLGYGQQNQLPISIAIFFGRRNDSPIFFLFLIIDRVVAWGRLFLGANVLATNSMLGFLSDFVFNNFLMF